MYKCIRRYCILRYKLKTVENFVNIRISPTYFNNRLYCARSSLKPANMGNSIVICITKIPVLNFTYFSEQKCFMHFNKPDNIRFFIFQIYKIKGKFQMNNYTKIELIFEKLKFTNIVLITILCHIYILYSSYKKR